MGRHVSQVPFGHSSLQKDKYLQIVFLFSKTPHFFSFPLPFRNSQILLGKPSYRPVGSTSYRRVFLSQNKTMNLGSFVVNRTISETEWLPDLFKVIQLPPGLKVRPSNHHLTIVRVTGITTYRTCWSCCPLLHVKTETAQSHKDKMSICFHFS